MKTIAVISPKGGVGCTLISWRLGLWLHEKYKKKVCIIGLDELSAGPEIIPGDPNGIKNPLYNSSYAKEMSVIEFVDEAIEAAMNPDYVIIDCKKEGRCKDYFLLLAYRKIDYSIIPTDDDPMSLDAATELNDALSFRRRPRCIVLNNIIKENYYETQKELNERKLSAIPGAFFREERSHFYENFTDSDIDILERIYENLKSREERPKKRRIRIISDIFEAVEYLDEQGIQIKGKLRSLIDK